MRVRAILGCASGLMVMIVVAGLLSYTHIAYADSKMVVEELDLELSFTISLPAGLTMGDWSYRALEVTDDGETFLALELTIELAAGQFELPPLSVDGQALADKNRSLGKGTLLGKSMKMGEKNTYSGFIFVSSFDDIEKVKITE